MHASNLAGTVDLVRRALKLVADEFRAAGDCASAAVELLAGDCGAEEAFLGACVGKGRVPSISGVVCGGERALRGSWVGEDGGCGREDGAEDESGVHCVGELGVRADGVVEVGELAFGLMEVGLDGILEGVVSRVDDGGGCWLVVSLLSLDVEIDGGSHLSGVPDAGQRLYVYNTTLPVLLRACPFYLQSRALRAPAGIYQPFSAIHTRTGRSHRSRAPTRCSGAREASCIVVKPGHLMEGRRYQGQMAFARLRHRASRSRLAPYGRKAAYMRWRLYAVWGCKHVGAQHLRLVGRPLSRVHVWLRVSERVRVSTDLQCIGRVPVCPPRGRAGQGRDWMSGVDDMCIHLIWCI
jgi:hypothetical protein